MKVIQYLLYGTNLITMSFIQEFCHTIYNNPYDIINFFTLAFEGSSDIKFLSSGSLVFIK